MVPSCLHLWSPACVVGGYLGCLSLGGSLLHRNQGSRVRVLPNPLPYFQGQSSGYLRSPILSARMSCPHVLSLSLPVVPCGPSPCGQLAPSPRAESTWREALGGSNREPVCLVCLKAFGCLTGSGLGPAGLLWRVGRCYLTRREIESQVN